MLTLWLEMVVHTPLVEMICVALVTELTTGTTCNENGENDVFCGRYEVGQEQQGIYDPNS